MIAMTEAAVVDVGSNSVRLVVYRVDGRAMTPILNEKVMAGLGRDVARSGALNPDGRRLALAGLQRFATLLEGLSVRSVAAVATAAVRTAVDGPAFVEDVRRVSGLKLRVIAGEEEARLSALGVLAGVPDADGIVGDLGGSSLELVRIGPDGPGRGESFSLGPLALAQPEGYDAAAAAAAVNAGLQSADMLRGQGGRFYAVGGAWRALGRIDIALKGHPIGVLHQHEMTRADVLRVVDFVRKQSRRSLERLEEAAAKRADALPYAASVLAGVMERGGFETVVLSSFGLREGVLYQSMPIAAKRQDALIAAAEAFGAPTVRVRAFGAALAAWLDPLFAARAPVFSAPRDQILRQAACRLADIGGALHPDQRAGVVHDLVLRAPLAGVSHAERAYLSLAVHHRYTKSAPKADEASGKLLNEDQRRAASALGVAMRLACDLTGRSEMLLGRFVLLQRNAHLVLQSDRAAGHLLTDQAIRRLAPLAEALGLSPLIETL